MVGTYTYVHTYYNSLTRLSGFLRQTVLGGTESRRVATALVNTTDHLSEGGSTRKEASHTCVGVFLVVVFAHYVMFA